jgi:hypothetical protein
LISIKLAGEQLKASLLKLTCQLLTDAFGRMSEGIVANLGISLKRGSAGFVGGLAKQF